MGKIIMARMYSKGRGKAKSIRPYLTERPSWIQLSNEQIEVKIIELAKKGMTESAIGAYLRDEMGIPCVKSVLQCKLTQVLRRGGVAPEVPDNLLALMRKNRQMRDHLEKNTKDKVTKFNLIRNESKIYRQIKWLKKLGKLPESFKFDKSRNNTLING